MRVMRKHSILAVLLAVILMGTLLTGCHGQVSMNSFEIPDAFDTSRTYEITFWAKNDTNKTQTAIYQQAIDDFHALYPNVTVNLRLYTNYGDIYNDVITNIAFVGGCNGNLKALSKVLDGWTVEQIEAKLKGNTCGMRPTSCADQLCVAVRKAYEEQNKA